MENDELEAKLDVHQDELGTLAREADRRLADVNHRLEVLASRGSMIIGAAAIASGVQISQGASVWLVCSVIASLAAAVLAIPLLRFRRGQEVNVGHLVKTLGTWSPNRLSLEVINAKTALIAAAEKWMKARSRVLLASLCMLAAAIGLTALRVIFG